MVVLALLVPLGGADGGFVGEVDCIAAAGDEQGLGGRAEVGIGVTWNAGVGVEGGFTRWRVGLAGGSEGSLRGASVAVGGIVLKSLFADALEHLECDGVVVVAVGLGVGDRAAVRVLDAVALALVVAVRLSLGMSLAGRHAGCQSASTVLVIDPVYSWEVLN